MRTRLDLERRAHQDRAAGIEQHHAVAGAEVQLPEQVVEVAEPHAARDHAGEGAVAVADAQSEIAAALSIAFGWARAWVARRRDAWRRGGRPQALARLQAYVEEGGAPPGRLFVIKMQVGTTTLLGPRMH